MQHYFRIPVIASQEKREESSDLNGLTDQICQAIAKKLMNDEKFQAELMEFWIMKKMSSRYSATAATGRGGVNHLS